MKSKTQHRISVKEGCKYSLFLEVFRSSFSHEGRTSNQEGEMGMSLCFREKLKKLPFRALGNPVQLSVPMLLFTDWSILKRSFPSRLSKTLVDPH